MRNFDVVDTAAQDFPLYHPFVEFLQLEFNTNTVQGLSLVLLQLTFVLAHQMWNGNEKRMRFKSDFF